MSDKDLKYFLRPRNPSFVTRPDEQFEICERIKAPHDYSPTWRSLGFPRGENRAKLICVALNYWHIEGIDIKCFFDNWYQIESGERIEGLE